MLARVAERIYWMARYLERVENTARMINVHGHALLDLPREIELGWEPLIAITGGEEAFARLGEAPGEREVVHFLLADRDNPGSVLSSLAWARENLRTSRDLIPREAWEQLNNLYLLTQQQLGQSPHPGQRDGALRAIIRGIQQINGTLAGALSRDSTHDFLLLGQSLERADMITRIIDVRATSVLHIREERGIPLSPIANVQWLSVLKSLTAYQMYRQASGLVRVRGAQVLEFLLRNARFPRALRFCIQQAEHCLRDLSHNEQAMVSLGILEKHLAEADMERLANEGLHDFLDELQISLGWVHTHIDNAYFTGRLR